MDGKVKRHITYHQSPTSPTPRRNYSHMGEETQWNNHEVNEFHLDITVASHNKVDQIQIQTKLNRVSNLILQVWCSLSCTSWNGWWNRWSRGGRSQIERMFFFFSGSPLISFGASCGGCDPYSCMPPSRKLPLLTWRFAVTGDTGWHTGDLWPYVWS
jgi:hypothetical protein